MKTHKIFFILLCLVSFLIKAQIIQDTSNTIKKDSIKSIYNPFSIEAKNKKIILRSGTISKEFDSQVHQSEQAPQVLTDLYVFRLQFVDKRESINFYGISLAAVQENPNSFFDGITINALLGDPFTKFDKPGSILFNAEVPRISVNGINLSFLGTGISGTINGCSFGLVHYSEEVNGIALATFTAINYLNGIEFGVISAVGEGNGILFSIIGNGYNVFRGITLGGLNSSAGEIPAEAHGIVMGFINFKVNVKGFSIGILNLGDSWVQIGLLNGGNSIIQIGLLNFDQDSKMNFPFISVKL